MAKEAPERSGDSGERRRRSALLALVLLFALAIAGIPLMRALIKKSEIENCLLSGRRNCVPIAAPAGE